MYLNNYIFKSHQRRSVLRSEHHTALAYLQKSLTPYVLSELANLSGCLDVK